MKLLSILILSFFAFIVCLTFSLFASLLPLRWSHPNLTSLMLQQGASSTQTWVSLSQIPKTFQRAVLAAEDGNFYQHHGIDFHEMQESFKKNVKKKKYARGFSTITMQLSKNLYLSRHKTLLRKSAEILIALGLEQVLSKNRILEIYLNVIEWGPHIYGAEAASRHYFKKSVSSLSSDESAFLASIIPSPVKWGHWPPGSFISRRTQMILTRIGVHREQPKSSPTTPEFPVFPESNPAEEDWDDNNLDE